LKADGIKEITLMDNEMILIGDCMEKVEISFAWEAYYEVNVYNCAGIPVKPFRVKV